MYSGGWEVLWRQHTLHRVKRDVQWRLGGRRKEEREELVRWTDKETVAVLALISFPRGSGNPTLGFNG